MKICLPNLYLSEGDMIFLLSKVLKSWTEIPLSPFSGYDKDVLKFYDGFLGTLIHQTEEVLKEWPEYGNDDFIKPWKYQGKLYRVLHECPHEDHRCIDGYRMELPKVDYHRMISHWTDDYSFEGLMYKLSSKTQCVILEANTGDHIGFDVNGFRNAFGCAEHFTEGEREIIFPTYKECIKEYRMTIEEFTKMKLQESNVQKSD